jgi:DNA-binding IclR family transcriptional regulator
MNQASYDLARLTRNGLITRVPHRNWYSLTCDDLKFAIQYKSPRPKATAARPSAREPSLALIVSLGLVLGPDVLVARARIFKVNK